MGSSVLLVNSAGGVVAGSTTRYQPFGAYRGAVPTQGVTELGYTSHRENMELGLVYMNARYYVPGLGRFASADTLVPDPTNPQQFNRFSYVLNNPIRLTDPSGHCAGSAVNEYGQQNMNDECWQWVWWLWEDWGRNELLQQYFVSLDIFWTLAYEESLDAEYWKTQFDSVNNAPRTKFNGLSGDAHSPIQRENPVHKPNQYCHRLPCSNQYSVNLTLTVGGPAGATIKTNGEMEFTGGTSTCLLVCYGKAINVGQYPEESVAIETSVGVGGGGKIDGVGIQFQMGYKQTNNNGAIGDLFASLTIGVFTIGVEYGPR